jgi:hypothetical protein
MKDTINAYTILIGKTEKEKDLQDTDVDKSTHKMGIKM